MGSVGRIKVGIVTGLYCRLDQGMKTALVLRELQSQDAGEKLSTDPS